MQQAYENFPRQKLNFTRLTLQSNLNEIIKCHGSNNYKIPHYTKERLERNEELPVSLVVTDQVQQQPDQDQEEEKEKQDNV
jgi:hypothetical protein